MILYENEVRGFWVCALTTLISSMISVGFSVAAVVQQRGNIVALYAASRSLSLLALVLAAMLLRSSAAMAGAAFAMALVQTCDAVIGIIAHDTSKTIGPLILALATFAAVMPMVRKNSKNSLGGAQP